MARKKKDVSLIENSPSLKKLALYIAIVDYGQSENIIRIYRRYNSSLQFVQNGNGTAEKAVRDILGLEDNRKEVVFGFIKEEIADDLRKELDAYFMSSKKNRGIAFTVKLNSMIGAKLYHFLSNTI